MIDFIAETGSTNADLLERLRESHVPEGYWLVADRQTAGRGRLGREWLDASGNFMGSTAVHVRQGDPEAATLALMAGLCVHEVVSRHLPAGRAAMLKWPNDILVDGGKLAGILLERAGDAVVIGIGVNLACAPRLDDRKTVALADLGPAPDRNRFAEELARQFAVELDRWRSFGLEPMLLRWGAAGHPVGTEMRVGSPGGDELWGSFAGLASDGALQLRLTDGTTRSIHSGEITFARLEP